MRRDYRVTRLPTLVYGAVFLLISSLSSGQLSAVDWQLPRGDAENTGSSEHTLPERLSEKWQFKADEAIEATPVIAGDHVFFADVFGKVYAVDRESGKEAWRKDYETGFVGSPVFGDGKLFLGDVEGNVFALNAPDGRELWKIATNGEISGSPALYKANILVASQDGHLYCFSSKDGTQVWSYQAEDQIRCSPTIAENRTFLGGCDGQLHIIDLDTGKAVGKPLPLGGPTGSTPAVLGDQAFLPIMDGVVYAFDWKQRSEQWTYADPDKQQEYRNSAAVKGNRLVLSSQRKQVDCLDTRNGKHLWQYTLKRRADASPLIAGDDVWIASSDGRLIRLSVESGDERWSYEIKGGFVSAPAVTDTDLFIADDEGVVRRFAP